MRGRHLADSSAGFYKDLAVMILGILLVGAAVFLVLYFAFGAGDSVSSTTSVPAATTLAEVTTTTAEVTTTTAPTPSTTTTTTTTVPVRPPAEVRVVVLNSAGLIGAAGRLTAVLADEGYQTLQAGDYQPEQDPSRIWYLEGFSVEANALLEYLPGALVEEIPDAAVLPGVDVILVLGVGYDG